MDNKENRLNEPIQSTHKKTAYASELTDTLGHKLGKNQIEGYSQQQLFYEDMNGQYIYMTDDGQTTITADKETDDPLKPIVSPTTEKVLTLILTKLNENFSGTNRVYLNDITADELKQKTTIRLPVADYMESVAITDRATARDNLKKASNELYNKSIKHTFKVSKNVTGKNGKKSTKRDTLTLEFRLLDAKAEFKSGDVIFFLSQRATPYLTEYSVKYSPKLLKTDIHTYPHSYKIGEYLNRQYERSKKQTNNGKITVSKILDNCDIPNIDEVDNRKYKEKIKEPLLDSLDYLKTIDVITDYSFYNKQGDQFTKYQCMDLKINEFVNLVLNYTMTDQ